MRRLFILILFGLFLIPIIISSQTTTLVQPQTRVALVIGNGNYISSVLANPENDAKAMAEALTKLGFVVNEYENLNQGQMKKAIDEFGENLRNNEVGLFYYAGHGIQSKGYNYLIPVDANLMTEKQVEYDCVQADRILALMEGSGAKVNIIILDACRNNPFERSWTRSETGKGLAFMNAPKGTLIAYATSPGSTASDGSGKNGLYTSAILESIIIPNITIIQMFQQVRSIVSQKSNDLQTPWESTSLTGDFYFYIKEIEKPGNNEIIQTNLSNTLTELKGEEYIVDSRDQQQYKTVKIGNQIWMAENLRATHFNDGTPIPLVMDKNTWTKLGNPAYCWYDNDGDYYNEIYGALYNIVAINTGKLCPLGWHIPSYEDWFLLFDTLGGKNLAGSKLKEAGTIHWTSPNKGSTNRSGFTALPGGFRNNFGKFVGVGRTGTWWSSIRFPGDYNYIMSWNVNNKNRKVETKYFYEKFTKDNDGSSVYYGFVVRSGYSVRCIKNP